MTPEQAAEAVTVTRREAEAAARGDLGRVKAQALQQGQVRAQGLFPAGHRPDPRTGRTGRSSRILRGWYIDVFSAAVCDRLGERVRVPSAAEVDATATALRRSLGSREPDAALRLVGSLQRRALSDAASAGTAWEKALAAAGPRRAAAQVARHQPAVDEFRAAILRHWYRRCYLAAVHAQMGVLQPLQAVTAGEAGVVEPPLTMRVQLSAVRTSNAVLRDRVTVSWMKGAAGSEDRRRRRLEWTAGAGVPAAAAALSWSRIPGDQQSRLIGYWLDTHRMPDAGPVILEEPELPFAGERRLLIGRPEVAAAAMFNHTADAATVVELAAASASFPVPAQDAARRTATASDSGHRTGRRALEQDLHR